jgi:formate hydrogenlyase subunit 4
MRNILLWTIQLLAVPALSPLAIGIVRKVKARLQNRQGAGVLQPYRDLRKLFAKDEIISADASWVFRFAPYAVFAVTLVVAAGIPVIAAAQNNILGDLLTIVYLLALGTFFLALAGIDVGSAFGGFGSSREMTVSALAEGGLVFSILSLAFVAHSSNLFKISAAIAALSPLAWAPLVLSAIAFVLALLAETSRFPFDNPATHLELTMIHEAMILEYSGKRLALMEWAAANKFMIFSLLAANLFFPWGFAATAGLLSVVAALALALAKILVVCLFVAFLESSIAKSRFFRLPDLLFVSFILSVIAIVLII